MIKKLLLTMMLAASTGCLQLHAADDLPALKVQGNQLVDENGKAVVLHGVMDTPSPYFNGNRWGNHTGVDMTEKCIEYFDKLFTAMTDHKQGAYCTVFRLHLDPCWTNAPGASSGYWHYKDGNGKDVTGEADNSNFSETLFKKYLESLYIPIIQKAISHGLYVVVRPPGVCPVNLDVNDATILGTKKTYQQYLKQVWWMFAQNEYVQQHSGQISIELANEPVNITMDKKNSDNAMTSYFQPIVNLLRTNSKTKGFTGIIWVPGTGWQSNYVGYGKYPISDPYNNIGYAVHCYTGWYGTDENGNGCNGPAMAKQFKKQVPVVETNPIIITEIDWSPEKEGAGHTDEHGNYVPANWGTWATGHTSKFGNAFKYVHDLYKNISMTLSGTATYLDIDQYLKNRRVTPAFDGIEEACGKACFDWYKAWYEQQHGSGTDGIETIANNADVIQTTYYNMQGMQVDKPQKGVYIVKQLLNNGNVISRKVCYTK